MFHMIRHWRYYRPWLIPGHYFKRLICKLFGHKWKSADRGGPESGGIGIKCTRCGEHHFQRLY